MTFFMVAGISCTIAAVICVLVYFIAHNMDEHSTASKIIIWVGTLLGVAGASLLTIEYSFPNISHPYVPTPYDHFVEYVGDGQIRYMEGELGYEVDEVIHVSHEEIYSYKEGDMSLRIYDTRIIYSYDSIPWDFRMVSKYEFSADYSYQNVNHYSYGGE